MPAPLRSDYLRQDKAASYFKSLKSTVFSETSRPSAVPPYIRHVAWSPTGAALANTNSSHIRIWNPEKPTVKSSQELKGHVGSVEKVAWNPTKENELASIGVDGTVKLWDVRVGSVGGSGKGQAVQDIKLGDRGFSLTWHPEGRELLAGRIDDMLVPIDVRMGLGDVTEALWTRDGTRLPGRLPGTQTNQCAFSNSGQEVFATMSDGTVRVLDWPSMDILYTLTGHTSSAYAVQHSPNGSCVAVGGGDSLVTLWDTTDWVCRSTLSHSASAVHNLSFSFDGTFICTGSGSDKDAPKGIEITNVETTDVVATLDTQYAPTTVAWHPLRYCLAYSGDSGGVKVYGLGSSV